MDGSVYTVLVSLHGHLAWLSLAALIHPVWWLRPGRPVTPRVRWTARIGALGLTSVYALGWFIYPRYRNGVKPRLLFDGTGVSPDIWAAYRFESKEHLAVLAVSLALAGLAVVEWAPRSEATRKAARMLLASALGVGITTAVLGAVVRAVAHPAF